MPTRSEAERSAEQVSVSRALQPPRKSQARQAQPSPLVFVGGLPTHTPEGEFLAHFAQFGNIVQYAFPTHRKFPDRNRGYAFLTFNSTEDALRVVSAPHDHVIRAKVVVSAARSPVRHHRLASLFRHPK